jgi:hypothetical protein
MRRMVTQRNGDDNAAPIPQSGQHLTRTGHRTYRRLSVPTESGFHSRADLKSLRILVSSSDNTGSRPSNCRSLIS